MESNSNLDPSNSSDDLSKKASKKIEEIKETQKELDDIQSRCKHSEYSLKNVGPEMGSTFKLRRICSVCSKDLGSAGPEELKKWLDG